MLVGIVVLIGLANLSDLVGNRAKKPTKSTLVSQPAAISHQQVSRFQTQQAVQAQRDAEQQRIDQVQRQPLQDTNDNLSGVPGTEADAAPPMTPAQRQSIYGGSPNAPQWTSTVSQAHAEAKQRKFACEKLLQDALNSDTVAIDFSQQVIAGGQNAPSRVANRKAPTPEDIIDGPSAAALDHACSPPQINARSTQPSLSTYPSDGYTGQLYRVFEGTVLEGVVTNHIDGAFAGPILVMLTTDYYSHDHHNCSCRPRVRSHTTAG